LEATPANAMKFSATEPAPGVFNFTQAEEFLAVAAGSNKTRYSMVRRVEEEVRLLDDR
jgi:hypothetical protein